MSGHPRRAGRRLALVAATTVTVVAGLGATAAPSMAKDLRVATTTSLTASPSTLDPSGSTTLTANVLPGFLVGPLGNVKFTDSTTGALLGEVKPRLECLLRRAPCVATITVPASALAAGDNTIVAAYSGGLFTKPSSGSTDVFVGTQSTCQAGSGTCTASTTSADGTTEGTVSTPPPGAGTTETVQAFFDNETPPSSCTTIGAGDTLVFNVTNPGGTKTVTLEFFGAAADAENALAGKFGNVCFGSTQAFTTDSGTPAVQAADGLFYGNLPLCDDNDGDNDNEDNESGGHLVVGATAFPCINNVDSGADSWATYTPASGSSQSTYTESFTTTIADPKAHG